MMVNLSGDASFSSRGLEHLKRAVMNHTGGIILMSHAGSWEMAAHHLKRELPEISLMLYMGAKHNERIEKLQKNDLKKTGIRVVAVDRDCGSPFDIVEGVKHLREGGMVSMTGDVLWRNDQRCVPVAFLGCEALLPETPYLLALLAHVPLYVFFAWRNGRKQYHVSISAPIVILKTSRDHRRNAVQKAAQQYADLLAQNIRRHPCQWYHFDPFLGKKII